ncbi:MAG: hypothetical protein ABL931_18800 [Usitatibacteraceae bacterium]
MSTKQGWARGALKLVIGNAATTQDVQTHVLEDGEPKPAPDLPLQEWARRCQLCFADLEIEKAVLIEAQNHVVQCQGRVMKAELLLERQQEEYRIAASKLPGVPCLK